MNKIFKYICSMQCMLAFWGVITLFVSIPVSAQNYPNKQIRLIVPFPAGGSSDLFARTIASKMSQSMGQIVIVDNKPGAGGTVGH